MTHDTKQEITNILNQTVVRGSRLLTRDEVETVLVMIDRHLQVNRHMGLTCCDWHILRDCIRPQMQCEHKGEFREWRRLYFVTLFLSIADLTVSSNVGFSSYCDRLNWLEQLVDEMSPSSFARTVLVTDSDPDFEEYIVAVVNQLIGLAQQMGSKGIVERLKRYKERRRIPREARSVKVSYFATSGPVMEPRGEVVAQIA